MALVEGVQLDDGDADYGHTGYDGDSWFHLPPPGIPGTE